MKNRSPEVNLTKRERVKRAIEHKETESIPYSINFTGDGIDIYGEHLISDYADEQIKSDHKNGMLSLSEALSIGIGNDLVYVYPPWWTWHQVPEYFKTKHETPDHLPDTHGRGSYEGFFKKVEHIREKYDVYLCAAIWGSHFERANFCRGIENFLADLAGDPEWAQSLLDLIIRKNMVMLENFISAADIDGVLLGSDWGTQEDLIMSPEVWRRMIKPGEKQEYDLIKKYGKDVIVHSCGNITKIMDDLVELGLDVLNPIQPECMDIYKIKETYGDALTFFGGISTQQTLPYGTPADVRKESEKVIEGMSKNGGYITGPSQEIQTDVPYENVKALIDTAKIYQKRR